MSEVTVFPLGTAAASGAPPTADVVAVAYGPHDARVLRSNGWLVADLSETYEADEQLRALEMALEFAKRVTLAAQQAGFDGELAQHLACDTIRYFCGWERFRHAVGSAKSVRVMMARPQEMSVADAYDFFESTGRIAPLEKISSLQAKILTWANRRIIRHLDRKPHLVEFVGGGFSVSLSQRVREETGSLRLKHVIRSNWTDAIGHVAKAIFRRRPVLRLPLIASQDILCRLSSFLSSALISDPPGNLLQRLQCSVERYEAARLGLSTILRSAAPDIDIVGLFQGVMIFPQPQHAAYAAALKSCGHKVIVFTHGSVCASGDGVAGEVTQLFAANGYVSSQSATHIIPRAPSLITQRLSPAAKVVPAVFKRGHPPRQTAGSEETSFRVLHAGNYVSWNSPHYVAPTEFDYYRSLFEFVEAAAQVENLHLTVRIKSTFGKNPHSTKEVWAAKTSIINPDDFFSDLTEKFNVFKSENSSLVDDLLAADLVVCEGWTSVIHDALELGKPVLFHTRSGEFSHLPTSKVLPQDHDRSAVYASSSGANLVKMLSAIMEAHHGRPLIDVELAGYRWPADVPSAMKCIDNIIWSDQARKLPDMRPPAIPWRTRHLASPRTKGRHL